LIALICASWRDHLRCTKRTSRDSRRMDQLDRSRGASIDAKRDPCAGRRVLML